MFQSCYLRFEHIKSHLIGSLLLGRLLVVLVHVRSKVTRIAVILHELIDMAGGLVEDVTIVLVLGHVLLRGFIGFRVDIDGTVGVCVYR